MRRRVQALGVVVALVAACSAGSDPSTVATTAAPTSTTTATAPPPTTRAATTTTFGDCTARPALAPPDPQRPRYAVQATIDPAAGTAQGSLAVTFTPDIAVDDLVFRLWPNSPTTAAAGVALAVGPVTGVDGVPLAAVLTDPTTLDVGLATVLGAGQSITVSMPWTLTVPGPSDDRVSHDGDSLRLGSVLPVLSWEPGLGWDREPATTLLGEAASSPVADWELTITVPADFDVLATGVPDGAGRWHATAVRDVGLSVGHFAIATTTVPLPDPVSVVVGVDAGVGESPDPYLARVVEALEDFAGRIGPYPWPVFTLAITDGIDGSGIEFPMHVMQGPGTTGRTTPHEVAHQWFYALVGNDQGRDPWLDEGLATYAEFTHEGTMEEAQARTIPPGAKGQTGQPVTFWESRPDTYYRGVYVQGAVAIASLGPQDQVDCALRRYVAANAYRIARVADLIASFTTVFPDTAGQLAPFGIYP